MDQKAFHMTLLFDFYGDLLTDRQKEFYDLYHNEDLSLAEIAENAGITRQGVRDVLVRAENTLEELEAMGVLDQVELVTYGNKVYGEDNGEQFPSTEMVFPEEEAPAME